MPWGELSSSDDKKSQQKVHVPVKKNISSLQYRKAIKFDDYIPGVRGLGCAKITNENTMIETCRCKLKITCYMVLICCETCGSPV